MTDGSGVTTWSTAAGELPVIADRLGVLHTVVRPFLLSIAKDATTKETEENEDGKID